MKEFLNLDDKKLNSWRITLLFILIAYLFSVGLRFIYIGIVDDIDSFHLNNQLMINNPDGYYYAQGARDIVEHKESYMSPLDNLNAKLTAFFANFLHLSIDTTILYLPGFLGSLVVVPLVLIGRVLGSSFVGFLAALLSGITWSYYHRTMFGYYDTDMLTVVLPTFAVWAVMWGLSSKNQKIFFIAPLIEVFMTEWHGGLFNIANGIFVMSFLYVLYLKFIKKEDVFRETLFLLFLIIPLIHFQSFVKYILVFALFGGVYLAKNSISKLNIKYFIWIVLGIYAILIGFPWLKNVLSSGYFTRVENISVDNIKYFNVVNTVSEAGHIDYNVLVHRISGSWIGVIVGILGYVLLAIRYPIVLVSLPMVFLGFFAIRGGLRFTIFTVPFMALGDAFVVYLIGKKISEFVINEKVERVFKYGISLVLMGALIYPNYKHIHQYIMPSVFNKKEIETLTKLHSIAKESDFVMSWWDYGYPIRYYAKMKTFVDGGRHSGDVNYPVSFALSRGFLASKNMAILDTFYTNLIDKSKGKFDIVKFIMNKYHLKSSDDIETLLSQNIPLPKIKEDIYYYLPLRMFRIFPTVAVFSSIDLKTGDEKRHFYMQTNSFKNIGDSVLLGGNVMIDLKKALLKIKGQTIPIKTFAITAYNKDGSIKKDIKHLRRRGLNVIFMRSYGKWLIVDDFYYNSLFFQLFIFENRNGMFESVINTPFVKVYKLVK